MVHNIGKMGKFANLRNRAQHYLSLQKESLPTIPPEDIQKLVHELDTYQIELELQNEDLRHIQGELDASRKRFSDLFDFAPVGYMTISEKGLIIECNLTAANLLGEDRRAILKKPLTRFIASEDQDTYYHHRKNLLALQESQSGEVRIKNKKGGTTYVLLESTVSPDIDGLAGQFRVCLTDISERKQLESLLEKSKNEWEKCFDAIPDIITIQDTEMNITRANKTAHEFVGVSPGALNGRKCYALFSDVPEPCPGCPTLENLVDATNHTEVITHERLNKIFQVSTAAIKEGSQIDYIVHVAKDITKQKKLEEELFHAHKMEAIGNLAGGIAHDFNNILTIILGFAELAQGRIPYDHPARRDIARILDSGKRAADLVQQILTYSRKKEYHFQPITPHQVIHEVLGMLRASLPTTIDIQTELDEDCGAILADPSNIHQILMNLCTNALHAMKDQKGTLTIQLFRKEI